MNMCALIVCGVMIMYGLNSVERRQALLWGLEEGSLAFTLSWINMFGNSNSAHLTSLCAKKRGEPLTTTFFTWSEWKKNCLWKALKPRQIVCWLHNNRRPVAVSSSSPWRNSFGKLILHFHGSRIERLQKGGKKAQKNCFHSNVPLVSFISKHSPTYWCTSSMTIQKSLYIWGFMKAHDNWILWDKGWSAFPCILVHLVL